MRVVLWSAIASIWTECSSTLDVGEPDVIVNVFGYGTWNICHERLFNDYVNLLLPLNELSVQDPIETVDFKTLVRHQQLGGRGCTSLVYRTSDPTSKLVFEGIDFRIFLNTCESGFAQEVMIFKHSTELVTNMPGHPNILPSPRTFVTISAPGTSIPVVCGSLYPFYPNGNLSETIEKCNAVGKRISLLLKARWCRQMAAALAHTHFVAHTYHMDIKPSNFILDENLDLVLIDWEQSDTPPP